MKFQYIVCYCSTINPIKRYCANRCISIHRMLLFNMISLISSLYASLYFNTSYVTVQLIKDMQIKRSTNISIHRMLLFNLWQRFGFLPFNGFQYIVCYCSTSENMKRSKNWLTNFNTSYVTVQPREKQAFEKRNTFLALIF